MEEGRTRFDYVKYDEGAQGLQHSIKMHCITLELFLNNLPEGRTKSLALTKLEEFYMWAGKAIRDEQVEKRAAEHQEERSSS